MTEIELPLRITVLHPPEGVAFAVQRGKAELLEAAHHSSDALVFDFAVRVGKSDSTMPRLLGPFTQGPTAARFVYVNSGKSAGQFDSPWQRRAKIPLSGITAEMIDLAVNTRGARIETEFEGTGKDRTPTCATVKGIVWRVIRPSG